MDIAYTRRGEGAPLVLVHGIGHRRQAWDPVFDLLARERDVIALDIPGFGDSPLPDDGRTLTMDVALDELSKFFVELGVERPDYVGNSLGGLLGVHAAKAGLISSLTALSPGGFFGVPGGLSALVLLSGSKLLTSVTPDAVLKAVIANGVTRKIFFGSVYGKPENLSAEALLGDAHALSNGKGYYPIARQIISQTWRKIPRDIPADIPITIGWGDRDRVLFPSQARRAQELLPQAHIVSLAGCGHVCMGDDPERVAELILRGR
jgi:pimeloyl-ACP methyl ester carboxylesterase